MQISLFIIPIDFRLTDGKNDSKMAIEISTLPSGQKVEMAIKKMEKHQFSKILTGLTLNSPRSNRHWGKSLLAPKGRI